VFFPGTIPNVMRPTKQKAKIKNHKMDKEIQMKKSIWIIGLLVLMASFSFAQPGKGMGMGQGMMRMEKMDGWLNLTDDQEKAMDKLSLDFEKNTLTLRNDLKAKRDELHLLMIQDNPGQKEIDKKMDEMGSVQMKLHKAMVDHKLAVRKLLNADQKVKWDGHLLKMECGPECGMGMHMGMGDEMPKMKIMKFQEKEKE
jgi:Spy/CpxP family protein refolding chaperone